MTVAERGFVVAVSGIPGSGKTTLLDLLLREFGQAKPVYYDHWQPDMSTEQIHEWMKRAGDPNELGFSKVIEEITFEMRLRPGSQTAPLVLFETAFGRVHRATGALIDFAVWINTPLDLALSRATLVFLDETRRDKAPDAATEFVGWLTRYMRHYPIQRGAYLDWTKRIADVSDLVLDGTKPAEELAQSVKAALAARGIQPV